MARPKVYITRIIPREGIDLLEQHCRVEVNPEDRPVWRRELLSAVHDADGILCLLTDRIDAAVFDAAKNAKGFANYAVGYDNIDVAEATKRGIPVSNTPGVLTDATSELAWALLFSTARRIVESDRFVRSGKWNGWGPLQYIGGDVTGKTLGVLGAGKIGTAMALKSKGFDMKVLYTDTRSNEVLEDLLGARRASFDELVVESDFISIHVPLTEDTYHLFDAEVFSKMKPTAYLINTSRGTVVNEKDLVDALQARRIAGAALDVFEFEPDISQGLAELVNVVITPHIGSATISSRTNMAIKAAQNLLAMIRGELPPDCVNPEVFE
ncbi:MAG: 2-hydroxyacid dehydrogenase [Desulfomonilia bacterium]